MSWATCYLDQGTNNIHFDKPPIVSDGRFYTSYVSSEAVNEKIKATEGLQSNWSYREYLQKNAKKIMEYNNLEAYSKLGINPGNTETKNKQVPNGYCNPESDLRNKYLSRNQLNLQMTAPNVYFIPPDLSGYD
jgi:predicted metal-dependent hydrolase